MEEFYYQKMDRQKQAVYHGMLQGVRQLADQIQLPRVDGKELYDIFFQMRLDHPEIFWVVGFSWKYYPDSPNLIFVPEYLFEKGKIKVKDPNSIIRSNVLWDFETFDDQIEACWYFSKK